MSPKAYLYALPRWLYDKHGIRRYGFHGISYSYITKRAAEEVGKSVEQTNLIVCHLGAGCSIAAVKKGESIDTSMGMTPVEGLVMSTR